ncbi:unnamed protein product [Ceratitis capitata]|uniref:(Mediterranean fruit fly) hypothetical protein n=1 Tax=Ceratitis capitata TaxID=7213 RepID=A0A811VHZ1_CERCA|nr:unnamed protein product [Ceratitis capitata]
MPRTEEPDGPQSMGCIKVGLKPATTNTSISKDHTQVCVCVCVCVVCGVISSLPSWSLSRILHVFLPLYLLTASRRPVRLAPPLPGALALAEELAQASCLPGGGRSRAWRGVKGGASVVRRGGAEALRSTAPPWLLLGLGTGQVPGKWGAQVSLRLGPQEVQRPRGAGGWEAAGPKTDTSGARAGLSSEWDRGEAPLSERGRSGVGRGGKGAETSTPLSPAPRPRAHACTQASRSMGGACCSGVGGVRGGRAGVSRLESGRGSCGSSTARPATRGAALARPAGQSEREAKRKALRAPKPTASGSGPISLRRPIRLISEAKQGRAWLGSWMGDHLGIPGARGFFAYQKRPGLPPRGPRAPPHSHSASRTPDDRQSVSIWGSFGLPQAIPGLHGLQPEPQPPPHPLPRRPSCMRKCARTHR